MLFRRLTMIAFAAAFAVSSSIALLQNAGPALADRDPNTRPGQNQRFDRDDWNRKHHPHHANNGRHPNPGHHYGQYKPHKRHPDRDRDHR